jgi:hypothetical protein
MNDLSGRRLQSNQRTNSKTRGVKNRKGKAIAGVGAQIAKRRSGIVRNMVPPDRTAQPEYAEGNKRNLMRGGSSICPRKRTVIEKPGNSEVLRRHFKTCPSGTGAISSPMTKNQRQRRPKEWKRGVHATHHPSRRNPNRGPGQTNKPERSADECFSPPVNHASAPARQPAMEAAPTQVAAIL